MAGLALLFVILLWRSRKLPEDLRAARVVLNRFRRKKQPPQPAAPEPYPGYWEGVKRSLTSSPHPKDE